MSMYFNLSLCYSSVHQKRSEAESSCVSMRSEASMGHPIEFKSVDTKTDLRYVFMFSAGQRLITINHIQNKSLCT